MSEDLNGVKNELVKLSKIVSEMEVESVKNKRNFNEIEELVTKNILAVLKRTFSEIKGEKLIKKPKKPVRKDVEKEIRKRKIVKYLNTKSKFGVRKILVVDALRDIFQNPGGKHYNDFREVCREKGLLLTLKRPMTIWLHPTDSFYSKEKTTRNSPGTTRERLSKVIDQLARSLKKIPFVKVFDYSGLFPHRKWGGTHYALLRNLAESKGHKTRKIGTQWYIIVDA